MNIDKMNEQTLRTELEDALEKLTLVRKRAMEIGPSDLPFALDIIAIVDEGREQDYLD